MLLPLRDDNPHTTTPFVNYALIAACVAVFLWQFSLGDAGDAAVMQFGLIPGHLFGTVALNPEYQALPAVMTIFTSMFLHGGWMHLGGNMLYLWIFGDNIEASLGHVRYLMFYLLCGVAAALAQSFSAPTSDVPMVGASGAIAGVLGAYLVLHPRSNIKVFVFLIIITVINVPAFIVLGFWFAGQLLSSAAADPGAPGVAFLAHIGGFIAGAVLVFFFKKRGVEVFARPQSRAFAVERRPLRRGRSALPDAGGRRGPWG
jgi:membrane associated rhomboid family serine protease